MPLSRDTAAVLGNLDLWSIMGAFLTPAECCRVMLTSRALRDTIKYNALLWKLQFASRWGYERLCSVKSDTGDRNRPDWLQAFERLQDLSNAALTGRWFEYDGYFSQSTSTYRFSLCLHCNEVLSSAAAERPEAAELPPDLAALQEKLLLDEARFRADFNEKIDDYVRAFGYVPLPKLVEAAPGAPYPLSLAPYMAQTAPPGAYLAEPDFDIDMFTDESTERAICTQQEGYQHFFPVVLSRDLLRIKRHHLSSLRNPSLSPNGCVSVAGVVTWTMESTVRDVRLGPSAQPLDTAQEMVQGFYKPDTRMLYLAGIGRSMTALDAQLGIDVYQLQVSSDGHSFAGYTLGNPEDGAWSNPMRGGTRLFRENVIAIMRAEVGSI